MSHVKNEAGLISLVHFENEVISLAPEVTQSRFARFAFCQERQGKDCFRRAGQSV